MRTEETPKPTQALRLLRDAAPTPVASSMLSTHGTPERQVIPRSCVKLFSIGDGRVMVLSYDAAGTVVEHWEGPERLATDTRLSAMEADITPPPLTLV